MRGKGEESKLSWAPKVIRIRALKRAEARAPERGVYAASLFAVIADHVPTMVGGPRAGWAYSIGYIKALLAAVSA